MAEGDFLNLDFLSGAGDIFSQINAMIDKITNLDTTDVMALVTLGFAFFVIALALYGMMKQKSQDMKNRR